MCIRDSLYFASDYFDQMYEAAVKLIKKGKAFVCDLTADQIREYREMCIRDSYSIIKPVFLYTCKSYNKEIGKPDESLGRKAIGPVKWQPVA